MGKVYNEMYGVGKARYVVNFHDGVKTHADGSPFFDCRIFGNRKVKDRFVRELRVGGYTNA